MNNTFYFNKVEELSEIKNLNEFCKKTFDFSIEQTSGFKNSCLFYAIMTSILNNGTIETKKKMFNILNFYDNDKIDGIHLRKFFHDRYVQLKIKCPEYLKEIYPNFEFPAIISKETKNLGEFDNIIDDAFNLSIIIVAIEFLANIYVINAKFKKENNQFEIHIYDFNVKKSQDNIVIFNYDNEVHFFGMKTNKKFQSTKLAQFFNVK